MTQGEAIRRIASFLILLRMEVKTAPGCNGGEVEDLIEVIRTRKFEDEKEKENDDR